MTRRQLTDGSGQWFDDDKATAFSETSRRAEGLDGQPIETYVKWDGHNHISLATGSQWEHEVVYLTTSGAWVFYEMSQYESTPETYNAISEAEALAWIHRHAEDNEDEIAALSENLRLRLEALTAELER